MIIVAAATLGHATVILICAATAASGIARTGDGAAASCVSIYNSVSCMLLCKFAFCESDLHVHRMHGSLSFNIYCISISRDLKFSFSVLKIGTVIFVSMSELCSI
jgi:hypothetical protein